MKPRALSKRARRILDALDKRVENQAMRKGADAVHLTAMVGAFHRAAGDVERVLSSGRTYRPQVLFAMMRAMRRIVAHHRELVGP